VDQVSDQSVDFDGIEQPTRRTRKAPLLRVQLATVVKEGSSPLAWRRLRGAADVFAAFAQFGAAADRESFFVVMLNSKHQVIGIEEGARGTLTATLVGAREVFKATIICSAAAIIVLHNHPSGDPSPSPEDFEITRRLREGAELLGIKMLDHVIIGRGRYVSSVDDGYW
jgi:DNA repair protein RadC